MEKLATILLMCLSNHLFSQVVWNEGTKWVYDASEGIPSFYQLVVKSDTLIQGKTCKILKHERYDMEQYVDENNKLASKWVKWQGYEYLAQYEDSILWYNSQTHLFDKLYDFTLKSGDVLEVNNLVSYKIRDVRDTIINGIACKVQVVDDLFYNDIIIKGIGSEMDFFNPSRSGVVLEDARKLMCFQNNQIHYSISDSACDLSFVNQIRHEKVFPSESKWYFSQINPYTMDSVYVDDITLENQIYQTLVYESSSPFYYKQGDSLWFVHEDKHYLAFNYSLGEGDSIELAVFGSILGISNSQLVEKDTVIYINYKLVSLESVSLGEVSYRVFNLESDDVFPEFIAETQFQFIEDIGCVNCWGIFPRFSPHTTTDKAHNLRCYEDSDKKYVSNFWSQYELPCDYNLSTATNDYSRSDFFQLYPTLLSEEFVVVPKENSVRYIIEVLNSHGLTVLQEEFTGTSVISLNESSGIYFVRIYDEVKNIFNQKIIKQ